MSPQPQTLLGSDWGPFYGQRFQLSHLLRPRYTWYPGTILGNPFHIGKDGSREEVIEKYRYFLWECMQNGSDLGRKIYELAGRHAVGEHIILLCACKPLPCHLDVTKRAIEWITHHHRLQSMSSSGQGTDSEKYPRTDAG